MKKYIDSLKFAPITTNINGNPPPLNSCFDEGAEYIIKLKFDYIKHNTTIAFPSIIFIKEPFAAIPYTITSKNSPEIVAGEIKITNDTQN